MNRFHLCVLLSGLALLATTRPAAAQGRWVSLGDIGGHRTAIDTAATVRQAGDRITVRLRFYDFAGAGIDQIETQEIDCRTERSRRLAAHEIATDRSPFVGDSLAPQPAADSTWKQSAVGSLGREQVRAVCRFLRTRGSSGDTRTGAGA